MSGAKKAVFVTSNQLEVKTADGAQTFTYDHVFDESDGQQVVFDHVARPVVQDLMDGYNATIFAYGQTSSGKTYTMEGASIDDPQLRGIIPRTATEIFNNVLAADENMEFIVKVSYIEIYMERIRDLLDPYKSKVNLQVREDLQRGIFVEGMTEISVTSDEELLSTMRDGAANRAVAATGMNEGSSRSHSVFMVTLYQRNLANQATKAGKLYLVDLAGSEMVRKTQASGKQLEEAKTINKSLSALGNVINALTDSGASHIPYRDSKLTRVLQESLGGNSKTNLIINVSPSSYNTPETISTLRFGNRAKSIKNKAVVNEQRSVEEYKAMLSRAEKTISSQQTYIISLEARLASLGVDVKKGDGDASSSVGKKQAPRGSTTPGAVVTEGINLELDDEVEDGAAEPTVRMRRSSSIRAAQALEELQERVTQLEEELNEEKAESTRRAQEIRILTAKAEEQNMALEKMQAAAEMMQKEKDQHAKSLEEKLLQSELLCNDLRSDFQRLTFEHQELVIHTEKVQREYDALLHELPSAATGAPPTNATAPGSPRRLTSSLGSTETTASSAAATAAATESTSSDTTPSATASTSASASSSSSAGESSKESIDLKARCQALEEELRHYEKEYRLLQANTEREKGRLLDDLEGKKAQIHELEMQLHGVATPPSSAVSESSSSSTLTAPASSSSNNTTSSSDGNNNPAFATFNGPSGMSARERQHMRSIQQKLEQLVAVHRQLLRKYASLELELAEAKKKIALRDERIKQVEANNRIMAGNMRLQAEKHVEELTHLRDQIADFRGAQRSHFEAQMLQNAETAAALSSSVIKTVRGGSMYSDNNVIRPIRGGGRRKTSAGGGSSTGKTTATTPSSGAQGANAPAASSSLQTVPSPSSSSGAASSGFLTRLFGKSGQ